MPSRAEASTLYEPIASNLVELTSHSGNDSNNCALNLVEETVREG
jgi:hypothetical protein